MVSRRWATRRQKRSQQGLTLIEVIVSIVILTIIGGVVAAIYGIGLKAVAPTGPQGRLLGAHDLEILEQTLGQDGARAACIQVPPGGTRYGSCSHGFASVAGANCPSGTTLCIGWPVVSDGSCHVAVYTVGSNVTATRAEYKGGTLLGSVPLARDAPVNMVVGTPVTGTPAGESYNWVKSLPITITSTVGTNPPSQTLTLQPVATDPAGANNALSGGAVPC